MYIMLTFGFHLNARGLGWLSILSRILKGSPWNWSKKSISNKSLWDRFGGHLPNDQKPKILFLKKRYWRAGRFSIEKKNGNWRVARLGFCSLIYIFPEEPTSIFTVFLLFILALLTKDSLHINSLLNRTHFHLMIWAHLSHFHFIWAHLSQTSTGKPSCIGSSQNPSQYSKGNTKTIYYTYYNEEASKILYGNDSACIELDAFSRSKIVLLHILKISIRW